MNFSLRFISIILSAFVLAACSGHDMPEMPAAEDEPICLRLTVFTSGQPESRAADDDPDTRIDDILVMLFTETSEGSGIPDKLWKALTATNLSDDLGNGSRTFDVKFAKTDASVPSHLLPVAVANAASRLNDIAGGASLLWGYSDVAQHLTSSISLRDSDDPLFTFWGIAEKNIDTDIRVQTCRIKMVRDLARITVNLKENVYADKGHRLAGALIYNRNNSIALIPNPENTDKDKIPVKPTILSTDDVTQCEDIATEAYGDYKPWTTLIPEQDILMGSADGDPADDNRFNRPALIVGAYFPSRKDKVYWYRVDFHDSDNKLIDIVRNHHYVINVDAINGPGEDTPEEAYRSQTAHIDAEIIKWEDVSRDVAFDGSSWIAIPSNVFMGGEADAEASVDFSTNVNPDLWELAWGNPGVSPETLAFATGTTISSPEFGLSVSCPESLEDGGKATLHIKTLSPLPDDAESATVCLYINVTPKLRIVINVNRSHDNGDGLHNLWNDRNIYEII